MHTIPSKETCRVYNHETFHVIASPVTVYNYNCRHISTLLHPQVPCFCKLKTNRLPAWGNNHLVVSQIKFNLTFRFPLFSCDDRIITFSFWKAFRFLSSYLWYSKKTFPGRHHLLHVWAWFRGKPSTVKPRYTAPRFTANPDIPRPFPFPQIGLNNKHT